MQINHYQKNTNNLKFGNLYRFTTNAKDLVVLNENILPMVRNTPCVADVIRGQTPFDDVFVQAIINYGKRFKAGTEWSLNNINKQLKTQISFPVNEQTVLFTTKDDCTKMLEFIHQQKKKFPVVAEGNTLRQISKINEFIEKSKVAYNKFLKDNNVKDIEGMDDLIFINKKGIIESPEMDLIL